MATSGTGSATVVGAREAARWPVAGLAALLVVSLLAPSQGAAARVRRCASSGRDRGDVPGWVLVTLMTAGLVVGLWAVAGPRLEDLFTQSMDRVLGQL